MKTVCKKLLGLMLVMLLLSAVPFQALAHSESGWYDYKDSRHYKICTDSECTEEHKKADDGNHYDGGNHTYVDDTGACTVCGIPHENHDFNGQSDHKCKICGYKSPEAHDLTSGECPVCHEKHTHTYSSSEHVCTVCGAAAPGAPTAAHTYELGDSGSTCIYCGETRQNLAGNYKLNITFKYKTDENGTHTFTATAQPTVVYKNDGGEVIYVSGEHFQLQGSKIVFHAQNYANGVIVSKELNANSTSYAHDGNVAENFGDMDVTGVHNVTIYLECLNDHSTAEPCAQCGKYDPNAVQKFEYKVYATLMVKADSLTGNNVYDKAFEIEARMDKDGNVDPSYKDGGFMTKRDGAGMTFHIKDYLLAKSGKDGSIVDKDGNAYELVSPTEGIVTLTYYSTTRKNDIVGIAQYTTGLKVTTHSNMPDGTDVTYTRTFKVGETLTYLSQPTAPTGYSFKGWSVDKGALPSAITTTYPEEYRYGYGNEKTGELHLYAIWEKTAFSVTVLFVKDANTSKQYVTPQYYGPITATSGTDYAKDMVVANRTAIEGMIGYDFPGYKYDGNFYANANCTTILPDTRTVSSCNYIYVKLVKKTYTLTLDINGGNSSSYTKGDLTKSGIAYGDTLNLGIVKYVNESKVFGGWEDRATGKVYKVNSSGVIEMKYEFEDDHTLYAYWISQAKVTLRVWVNGSTYSPDLILDVTDMAPGGVLDYNDVARLIQQRYAAKDGGTLHISYLYTDDDWASYKYSENNTSGRPSVQVSNGTVIHVMVNNAKMSNKLIADYPNVGNGTLTATATTAYKPYDYSNPKTGDETPVGAAIAVMMVAAGSLAAAWFYYRKKKSF